jgi:hypothetical protein
MVPKGRKKDAANFLEIVGGKETALTKYVLKAFS